MFPLSQKIVFTLNRNQNIYFLDMKRISAIFFSIVFCNRMFFEKINIAPPGLMRCGVKYCISVKPAVICGVHLNSQDQISPAQCPVGLRPALPHHKLVMPYCYDRQIHIPYFRHSQLICQLDLNSHVYTRETNPKSKPWENYRYHTQNIHHHLCSDETIK